VLWSVGSDLPEQMNISIITNFGCSRNCWYCIWKDHALRECKCDTDWNKIIQFLDSNSSHLKISISGGGDPLYNYSQNQLWWDKLFSICNTRNLMVDVHTRERLTDDIFWSKINRCVLSSDSLDGDKQYAEYLTKVTKLRISHVITNNTTTDIIKSYIEFCDRLSCQLTFKQLHGYDTSYDQYKKMFSQSYFLDDGDYNIYYMPNNTVTNKFI